MHCDNHCVVHLAENPGFHNKKKHMHRRCCFIIELISDGILSFKIFDTKNPVDMCYQCCDSDDKKVEVMNGFN